MPGLDGAQRQRLIEAGIIFYDWAGDLLVEEPQLQAALKVLGATATEQATDYENMFKLALRYVSADAPKPKRKARDEDSPLARSRALYIKTCSSRVQALVAEAVNVAAQKQGALPAAYTLFAQWSRIESFAKEKLDEQAKRAEFVEELQRLREIPQVRDVRVVPGVLLVYTHKLYATARDTKARHEVGEFLIRIRLDGTNGGVRWFNSSRRINGVRPAMNAPNVYADGTPCADEMVQTLIELIAQCQFATVAELAIQFIETTEDDELGKTLDRWPLAK
jgi:hypothetical protein